MGRRPKADKARRVLVALEQLHRVEQWKMADLERRLAELENEQVELIGALNDDECPAWPVHRHDGAPPRHYGGGGGAGGARQGGPGAEDEGARTRVKISERVTLAHEQEAVREREAQGALGYRGADGRQQAHKPPVRLSGHSAGTCNSLPRTRDRGDHPSVRHRARRCACRRSREVPGSRRAAGPLARDGRGVAIRRRAGFSVALAPSAVSADVGRSRTATTPARRLRPVRGLRSAELRAVDAAAECHQRVRQGIAGEFWRSMLAEKMGEELARSGQVGIARQLEAAAETHTTCRSRSRFGGTRGQ